MNINRILKLLIMPLAIAMAGLGSARAQSVTVDVGGAIQGALGKFNGGYYLAGGIGTATVTFINGSGVPSGTNTSGTIGGDISVPKLGISGVGLSVTWNLSLGPGGAIVINYTSHIGLLTTSGQILTKASATGLPGYTAPGSSPSHSTQSSSEDSSGINFLYASDDGSDGDFDFMYDDGSDPPAPEGNVTIGTAVVVNYYE